MKLFWLVLLVFFIIKTFSRLAKKGPGQEQDRGPAGGDKLPEPGREESYASSERDDLPLPGPWSLPRVPSPAPAPADDGYVQGPWGRSPVPERPAKNQDILRGKPEGSRPAARQGKREESDTAEGDMSFPRRRSGTHPWEGERDRGAGKRNGDKKDKHGAGQKRKAADMPAPDNAGLKASGDMNHRPGLFRGANCRESIGVMLTPGNIKTAIILTELLGPRGGRARRR